MSPESWRPASGRQAAPERRVLPTPDLIHQQLVVENEVVVVGRLVVELEVVGLQVVELEVVGRQVVELEVVGRQVDEMEVVGRQVLGWQVVEMVEL